MRGQLLSTFLGMCLLTPAFSQTPKTDLYITANGNMYTPLGKSNKASYPILWYDSDTDSKTMIGGFGIGFAGMRKVSENMWVKGQANVSKHTFWDDFMDYKDDRGKTIMHYTGGGSNYSVGLSATAHLPLSETVFLGTGLGTQVLLVSLSRRPPISTSAEAVNSEIVVNKHYRAFLPTLPLELTFKTKKKLYNIRYELGLLSPYKKDLGKAKKEGAGFLTFEIGFKLGAKKESTPQESEN